MFEICFFSFAKQMSNFEGAWIPGIVAEHRIKLMLIYPRLTWPWHKKNGFWWVSIVYILYMIYYGIWSWYDKYDMLSIYIWDIIDIIMIWEHGICLSNPSRYELIYGTIYILARIPLHGSLLLYTIRFHPMCYGQNTG